MAPSLLSVLESMREKIDALNESLIAGQQGLQRLQVIPADTHVPAVVRAVCILLFQHLERDLLVVVDNFRFSNPVKCRHIIPPRQQNLFEKSLE